MQRHQPQFDTLRALAVLSVLLDHFAVNIPNFPLPDCVHLGSLGVRFFLVLSGYFITLSLLRMRVDIEEKRATTISSLVTFYGKRLLRIGPPYAIFVGICLLLGLGAVREQLPWLLTFTLNFFIALKNQWPEVISHLWSICVQEQFYLVWPSLLFLVSRRLMLPAMIGLGLVCLLFRIGCVMSDAPLVVRWMLPFGSLDAFVAGAVVAWKSESLSKIVLKLGTYGRLALSLIALSFVVAAGILRNGPQQSFLLISAECLEALGLAYFILRTRIGFKGTPGKILSLPLLVKLGAISYGLYVYHVLVAVCFDNWTPPSLRWTIDIPILRLITLTSATLVVAGLSWRYLEAPLIRLHQPARFKEAS